MNLLQKTRFFLTKKDKKRIFLLIIFSVVVAMVEAVGISAIMMFIDISTNFSTIKTNPYYKNIFSFLNFQSERNFAIVFGFFLLGFYVCRAFINVLYTYSIQHFSSHVAAKIKQQLFRHYLALNYRDYTRKNYSLMNKAIITEANGVSSIAANILLIISEAFVMLLLYSLMLMASWEITLAFTFITAIKILTLVKPISKKIKQIGTKKEKVTANLYKLLSQSFGNFKYIKLQSNDFLNSLQERFSIITQQEAKIGIHYGTLTIIPRLLLETIGFSLVILLLIYLLYQQSGNIAYILPTLSLFVLALYRLLPSVNRIIVGYNTIAYYHRSLGVISEHIAFNIENLDNQKIAFTDNIQLMNVCFHYHGGNKVLNNINLTINKGDKIAFIGASGSGKSTLVDLIIGLYRPESGQLKIDGKTVNDSNIQNWRTKIGYIPQQVYLFDGTVAENICFGSVMDEDRLIKVLKQANIFDFLQEKSGVDTKVGDGGVQLSGGQKQRVAIARALYNDPEILVLDEATSALDNEIEQKIINEIYEISDNKTLIIIAHRLSTIAHCDKIYKIVNGIVSINK